MGPMRQRVLSAIFYEVKESATNDPDMLECAKSQVKALIDAIAEDVELQVEERMRIAVGGTTVFADDLPKEPFRVSCCRRCCCGYLRPRAFILSRLFPHDKTLWGNFRDPCWWLLVLPALVTYFNVRCTVLGIVLILLMFPGRPDEHQLTKYIITFKFNQFLTAGVGCMTHGAVQYYGCILLRDATSDASDLSTCIAAVTLNRYGVWLCLLDYFGSWLLPRIALLGFYWSQRLVPRHGPSLGGQRPFRRILTANVHRQLPTQQTCCEWIRAQLCCCPLPIPPRLRILMHYDTICFNLSIFILITLTMVSLRNEGHWHFGEMFESCNWMECLERPSVVLNAYWCRVFYAISALPFVLLWGQDFTPGSFSLVTQSARTGYNKEGECVLFQMRPPPEESDSDSGDERMGSSFSTSSHSSSDSDSENAPKKSGWFGWDWRMC